MTVANPVLTQLKDIHNPAAPTIWPLAPGWYVVIILLLSGFIIAISYYWVKVYRRQRYRKMALAELLQLESTVSQADDISQIIATLAMLLKRTALAAYPSALVAGLTGTAWLTFLDETGQTTVFTQGVGQYLLTAPYQQAATEVPLAALIQVTRRWINQHKLIRN